MSGARSKIGPIPDDHFENDAVVPGAPLLSEEQEQAERAKMAADLAKAQRLRKKQD